jgi:hypothetical protein
MVDSLMGVDDQPVAHVSNNGLVAAVSRITREDLKPDMSLIMAYKKVVDSFHREQTVIPMRFGCLLKEKKQVAQLLEKNRTQYEALLKKLDGCVEMGIRVLIDDCRLSIEDLNNNNPAPGTRHAASPMNRDFRHKSGGQVRYAPTSNRQPATRTSGQAYLTSRKAYYDQEDKLGKEIDTIIEQYRKAFSGLYVKFKAEYPSTGNLQFSIFNHQSQTPNPLVSLYFLVPRQSVERFRRVFRRICSGQSARLLMTGPWPPFNFVTHCSAGDTREDLEPGSY